MRSKVAVQIPAKPESNYEVWVGSGVANHLAEFINFSKYSKIAVITDSHVDGLWFKTFSQALPIEPVKIVIEAGEDFKNHETLSLVWKDMSKFNLDRKSLVINLGGGVVGDLGGFAAATYMRGLDFVQVPTTLLAQVDASVGGKLAINFSTIKNLVGSFCQPQLVICDIDFFKTLPERELIAGYAEIVKHGLIRSKKYLDYVTLRNTKQLSKEELITIIRGSVEIKAHVVSKDEGEKGYRKILNFGHTVGHAIESLSHESGADPYLHGEAISLGMVVEAKLSELAGHISSSDFNFVKNSLSTVGLPIKINKKINFADIFDKMIKDKKNVSGKIMWVLLGKIGQAVFDQELSRSQIVEAMETIKP